MARMGDFGVIDYTPLMALAPRTENFLEKLGIFSPETADYIDNRYAEFEREELGVTDMHNVARGANRQFIGSEKARKEIVEAPFATLDGVTKPNEVEAFRQYGTEDSSASIEALVERKIAHIQRSHAKYIRDCQYTAIRENKIRAIDENGAEIPALAKNFSTMWGAPRQTATIATGTAGTDPFATLGAARQDIMDAMGKNTGFSTMAVLVNTRSFNAITGHALVRAAFDGRDKGGEEYLTRRLGNDALYQTFTFKGVTLIEDTSNQIQDGEGFMIPLDYEGMFQHMYCPADTVDHVNQISQGSFLFLDESHWRKHVIESEVSYVVGINRPELLCDLTITY
jgi:hypothetical protein